jgi:hypothetical protein
MMWSIAHYCRVSGAINAAESSYLRDGGIWCLKSSFSEVYLWLA